MNPDENILFPVDIAHHHRNVLTTIYTGFITNGPKLPESSWK